MQNDYYIMAFLFSLIVVYVYWLEKNKGNKVPNILNIIILAVIYAILDYLTSIVMPVAHKGFWTTIAYGVIFSMCFYPFYIVLDSILKEYVPLKIKQAEKVDKKSAGYKFMKFFIYIPTLITIFLILKYLMPNNLWTGLEPVKSGLLMFYIMYYIRRKINKKYFTKNGNL